jgi:uncharacterized membrane protein SirB2
MSDLTARKWAIVSGAAAAAALAFIAIFFIGVPLFGPLNDIALLVMGVAAFPVAHRLAEGRPAVWLAYLGLAVWCAVQVLMIAHVVQFDYSSGRNRAFLVSMAGMAVFGAGLTILVAQAPDLGRLRWVGIPAAAGFLVTGLGDFAFGLNHPVTYAGAITWQLLWPVFTIWLGIRLTHPSGRPTTALGAR